MATELYIDGKLCDLEKKEVIAMSYGVNRLTDIESRQGYYSNTFKLPLTANNLDIFGIPTELNSSDTARWDRLECTIITDGVYQVFGFAQLQSVKDSISVVVKGGNSEFVDDIRDKYLTELELSDLDHLVTEPNVSANRFNDYTSGFVYPDIDYNFFRNIPDPYPFWMFYAATFAIRILTQIVEDAGYTLTGRVITNPLLRKMIVPFCRPFRATSEEFRISQTFKAQLIPHTITYSGVTQLSTFAGFNNDSVDGFFDNSGDFTTGDWLLFPGTISPNSFYYPAISFNQIVKFKCTLIVTDWSAGCSLKISISTALEDINFDMYVHEEEANSDGTFTIALAISQTVTPNHGNYILVEIDGSTTDPVVEFLSGEMWNEPSEEMSFFQPINTAANLPDMLQRDFLKYIVNAFCLIISTDKINNIVSLTYFDDLPTNTSDDWSDKIDKTEQPNFMPNYGGYSQHNLLKYSNNTSDESLKNSKEYAKYDITKEIAPKGDKTIYKSIFSASRPVDERPDRMFINLSESKERTKMPFTAPMTINSYIPTITVESTELMSAGDTVIIQNLSQQTTRYFGILLDGLIGVTIYDITSPTTFRLAGIFTTPSTTGDVIHMKDGLKTKDPKPRIAVHDIIGGDEGNVIQILGASTVNQSSQVTFTELEWINLTNDYWTTLTNIIKNPQTVKMLMILSSVDINQLDFTKPKWIDLYNCYFYLSFVSQYKVNQVESTEVELIKLP